MKFRIQFLFFLVLLFSAFLMIKGAQLQLFPKTRLITLKKRLFEKVVTIKPQRGMIYDRYGRELALSISSDSLFADPFLIQNPRRVAQRLSKLLGISQNQISKKIRNKKRRFVWIKRHLSEKERQTLSRWNIYGLGFIEEPKRIYPNAQLLAQVLGFTGIDGRGLEGLELFYDSILRGHEQKIVTSRDARGRPLFIDGGVRIDQSKGSDIYLTIDSDLQFVLERELGRTLEKFQAESALGIILNAQTSEILALAQLPSFNPNEPFRFEPFLYRNRVVTDLFEPGSTFKTFVIATALQEGMAPHTQFYGEKGRFKIGKHTITEADSKKKFEDLSLSEILTLSSNVGAAKIALDLKDHVLFSSLKKFGFGNKLGVDFPLEGKGILKDPPWRNIETATIGFGHGISVTLLQMITAYTSIANGGWLKNPYILKSVVNVSGQETLTQEPSRQRVLTPQQAQTLTLMLTQATSQKGTGYNARISGYLTAGKTGTAQKPNSESGGYLPGKYLSSFIGFLPADQPQFVIAILLDSPEDEFYGSRVAAPIFSTVGNYAVRRSGIPPSYIEEPNILKKQENPEPLVSPVQNLSTEKTPEFKGLSLREALTKAQSLDIKVRIKGSGLVQSSSPHAGENLPQNRIVTLTLGSQK